MMRWFVNTSLKQPVVVLAAAVALLAVGFWMLRGTPLDVFPEFAPPLVEIQTEAPGLTTEEVESLITVPLENAVNGVAKLKTLRSKSVLGLSSVVLIFEPGADLMQARQLVQERLAVEASRLPTVARPPVLLSPLSSTSRVLKIGIWSDKLSQMDMTLLAKWTIRPRLMAVPGVANVAIWGQRDRQYQVLVEPERLRMHGITLDQVVRAAGDAAVVSGGGFVDTPNQRLPVRQAAAIVEPEDLARTIVAYRNGAPLRLEDVADVVVGHPPPIGDAVINDRPGLLLIVEKQPWGNTLDVTRRVEAALDALRPGLGGLEIDSTIFRPATFIERALANLTYSLLMGCVLVVAVLAVFLFDWRTALISSTAIPLSLMTAAIALALVGTTMNTMVLAGLVIALGEVVDDAIIDVENIMRRLRLNRTAHIPRTAFRVVLDASLEVRSAVVFGTLTVILVILPVFFMSGLAGSFFRPLAVSYVLAIFASLLVALTVTPAMCLLLLPGMADRNKESPVVRWLKHLYGRALPPLVANPLASVVVLVVCFLAASATVPFLGEEFMPKFQETDFLMHWVEKPGTSLAAMERITERASGELRAIPGVRNFGSHIGRAEVADEVVGPNFTELWISLDPNVDYKGTVGKVQDVVDGYPGLYRDLQTYLQERIKEVLTGTSASIVVRIYGADLPVLREKAHEVEQIMSSVANTTNVKLEPQVLVPQIEVRLRRDAADQFGLTPGDVRRAVTTLVKGTKVGEVYQRQQVFDVAVWGTAETRADLTSLQDLLIETPTGSRVPLGDVATVAIVAAPNEIKREGASRRIDITCNVKGGNLGKVARDIETQVKDLSFEPGYHPEFLGEYAARRQSLWLLIGVGILAGAGIIVLLYGEFRSVRLVILVLVAFLFAIIGAILGAWTGGGMLSLGSWVGFITVLGLSVRNSIMLLSHYQHLEHVEHEPFGVPLVLRGAQERLAPILMTALTTAIGLVPLVIAGNRPGNEIEHPMALVIFGGLVTSTLLNLLVMPGLYWMTGGRELAPSDSPTASAQKTSNLKDG